MVSELAAEHVAEFLAEMGGSKLDLLTLLTLTTVIPRSLPRSDPFTRLGATLSISGVSRSCIDFVADFSYLTEESR